MGDSRRFDVTAAFIARNFRPCRVADVAGGKGELSIILRRCGYTCSVIDIRKGADIRARFTPDMAIPDLIGGYDLLVGLHPDGATEALAQAALSGIPTVIIPCCQFWQGIDSHGAQNAADCVRRYWKKHKVPFWETLLKMNGKNVVLVAGGVHGAT